MNRPGMSRRVINRGSVGLAFALASGASHAMTPPKPMGEAELRKLLDLYDAARREASVQQAPSRIAAILARRDQAAGQLLKSSAGSFEDWPATGRIVKLNERGDRLGMAVELAERITLQTELGDDFASRRTVIAKSNPVFEPARQSRNRLVRVSGYLMLNPAGAPIDLRAATADAGRESSLLTLFINVKDAT